MADHYFSNDPSSKSDRNDGNSPFVDLDLLFI